MPNKRGLFISLEGIDGAGKSTQASALAAHLAARGHDVVQTREPGGSKGAEEIRALLVQGDTHRWSPETEILLFTAARRDHLERLIEPALARGQTVITDRFADSTRVYQGVVRAELADMVDALHSLAIVREPDVTIVIDMDPEVALARGIARNTADARFESFGLGFQEKLRAGFRDLAGKYDRMHLVDGNSDAATVAAGIAAVIDGVLDG